MRITRYQAKAALLEAGLLDQVESLIASSDDELLQLAWGEGGFYRQSAFVDNVASQLGMTPLEVDALFVSGEKFK